MVIKFDRKEEMGKDNGDRENERMLVCLWTYITMKDNNVLFQALDLRQHNCKVWGGGEIVMILQDFNGDPESEHQNLKLDRRDTLGFLLMLLSRFLSEHLYFISNCFF